MTGSERSELACGLSSLSVFRGLLAKKELSALLAFLKCEGDSREKMELYGEFVFSLADSGYCFSDFLRKAVCEDENFYVKCSASHKPIPRSAAENAAAELRLFTRLTALSAEDLCSSVGSPGYVPRFENSATDFEKLYAERLSQIGRFGYGIFASSAMFRVQDGNIVPVASADKTSPEDFIGYDEERRRVMENTKALADGRPAANVLLCGDAGTGKSSTVKACANYFFDSGVRLIELRKDQLFSLPAVMDHISGNPLKFIVFIDDLSFNKNDDCFGMLKAALEGSASAKAENAVIYATSNRRHIIKESFSEREGDDIHRSDTVQELMSLSDRFGLTVYFSKPGKALYLEIVHGLARRNGITKDPSALDIEAEAFALRRGSRSPRTAEQFVMSLM